MTEEIEGYNEQIASRLSKLKELSESNIEPYAGPFETGHEAASVLEKHQGRSKESLDADPVDVRMAGRIIMLRSFGKAAFAHIQDATGRIQIYLRKDLLADNDFVLLKKIDVGDIVGVSGRLFRTKTDELTVEVSTLKLLTKSLRPLPEKWHGLKDIEMRYRQRYVDLIVNPAVRETFRTRSAIIKSIRDFLDANGFMEVETPMMQPVPGGAAAKPFKTHHNALGVDLYLRIAPELYLKRLLVGGFERVYEINRNFRNEGISIKHNPEFTMLEFYMAYKDYNFLMRFTEQMIQDITMRTLGTTKFSYGNLTIDLTPPWPKIPMLEALKKEGVPEGIFNDRDAAIKWGRDNGIDIKSGASLGKALDEIFSDRVEPRLIQPTFITDYPVELSPLSKRKKDNPDLVERFELFIAGREIANAFSELNDPMDQKERFAAQMREREEGDEESHRMDEDFIAALEYGMPPAAGEGIGIDRLVMLLTNSHSIRDVLFFPQLKPQG